MEALKVVVALAALGAIAVAAVVAGQFIAQWLAGLSIFQRLGVYLAASAAATAALPGWGSSAAQWAFLGYWLAIWLFAGWMMRKAGGGYNADHVRGNAIVPAKAVKAMLKREDSQFSIGDIPFPRRFEVLGFLIVGAIGTGKSQTFHQILGPVRKNGQRAVVADVGGEFTARYFKKGDQVFNPFDRRSISWSPLAEMRGEWDADKLAKSVVPDGFGSGAEWNGYAQTLLSAVLLRLWESGAGNNGEMLRLLTRAPADEIKNFVAGCPAEGLFAEGSERMLASIMGILSSYIKPFQHLDPAAGNDAFSIRDWMENEDGSWLFLNFTDSQFPALKPLIAAVLDVSISSLLEMKPNADRRCWFAVDEFATFGAIQSIEPLLTKGRKYGAAAILGLQSISQIRESYGQQKAQTLLGCLGTWTVLRCQDAETAEYMSRYVGDEEIRRETVSTSSKGIEMATTSTGSEWRTQRAVLPSEIAQLPNLTAILNVVGETPPCVVQIPVSQGAEVAERFEAKPREKRLMQSADPVADLA